MERIFGKIKNSPRETLSPVCPFSLPDTFAEEVLDLQGKLDLHCRIPTIKRLMELYSNAVEYYESKKDPKYLLYQDRLQVLLTRKDVLAALDNPQEKPASKTQLINIKKEKLSKRERIFSKKAQTQHNSDLFAQRSAEKTLQVHQTESSIQMNLLKQNLLNQHSSLSRRIQQRKVRTRGNSLKANKRISLELVQEEDASGGSSSHAILNKYQDEMEKVVGKYMELKNQIKEKIEKKYWDEIEDMKELGDLSIFESIAEEMKKQMASEIENEHQKLDREKKLEIMKLRFGRK